MTYTEHEFLLNKPINPATSPDVGGIFQAVTPPPGLIVCPINVQSMTRWGSLQLGIVGGRKKNSKNRAGSFLHPLEYILIISFH